MAASIEDVVRDWDGEEVVVRFDEPTGAWMFVCVHSRVLGPAGGGTRMKVYSSPAEALVDGTRLAAGMTAKFAVPGLPFGGGKAVLAVPRLPEGQERRELLHRYADLICSLGGNYLTGCDMNTTPADLDVIRETCPHTFGHTSGSGEPGPFTARGVFHGIRASVAHLEGSPSLVGRRVLVQGVGSVGARLAAALVDDGAEVLVTDVDTTRADALASSLGTRAIDPADAMTTGCDVYAPCATGGTLSAETIPGLRCRIVAGAANNQLIEPADADRLREGGILYAPDFVINAGGIFHNVGREALGWGDAEVEQALAGIGDTLTTIYERSEADDVSTGGVALDLAAERLAAAR
ncbi:MAG TPA: Glu/Leu/Phe/Val dehydrogenase dimerization domain-containing protein [Gaiellaceae bacterium]|jgi:leucine dehydrogenase|nr:Glu/Leu/Phe/Val dehydrogenase dimerization domain-containing protein [Gaiellaceae bacterium]